MGALHTYSHYSSIIIFSQDDKNPVALMSGGGHIKSFRSNDSQRAGYTENPPSGSFPKDMRSQGSCSTCFPMLCRDMGHGCVFGLSSWRACLQECPSLLKCSATGDSSVLLCTMSKWWLLTLQCNSCPVSPTYCWPHLLHTRSWWRPFESRNVDVCWCRTKCMHFTSKRHCEELAGNEADQSPSNSCLDLTAS